MCQKPHAPAALAGRDGGAALADRRRHPRLEARDPAVARPLARGRENSTPTSCAGQYPRVSEGGRGSRRSRAPDHSSRCSFHPTTGAGTASPSCWRTCQAAAEALQREKSRSHLKGSRRFCSTSYPRGDSRAESWDPHHSADECFSFGIICSGPVLTSRSCR